MGGFQKMRNALVLFCQQVVPKAIKQENFKPEWFLKGNVPSLHRKAFLLHNPNQTLTMKLLLWVFVLPPPLSCSVTHQEQGGATWM